MKLTPAQLSALRKVADHGPLCIDRSENEAEYVLLGTHKPLSRDVSRRLIDMGALAPQSDGMFGASQTFVISTEAAALL